MRIDINAYLGRWDFRSQGIDAPEALLTKEAEAGVDVAIVSCPGGLVADAKFKANRDLLEKIKPYPGRLFMVARVDPAWDVAETIRFLDSHAVAAIRLPAARNERFRTQERELIVAAHVRHLPVYLTLGVAHLWYVAEEMVPELVGPIVADYPEATFVVAGDGQFQYPKLAPVIKSCNNIYMDISRNSGLRFTEKYVNDFGLERVLFGTSAGIVHPCLARDKVEMSRLTTVQKEAIYARNALRIFGRLSNAIA